MKKRMIALAMAFALMISLCACGGDSDKPSEGKTLLEHGLEVVATMDEMAGSDEYINFYTGSKEMAEIVKDIGKGDHSAPIAVYKITIDVFITGSHLIHGGNDIKPVLQQCLAAGCIAALTSAGTKRKYQQERQCNCGYPPIFHHCYVPPSS